MSFITIVKNFLEKSFWTTKWKEVLKKLGLDSHIYFKRSIVVASLVPTKGELLAIYEEVSYIDSYA